MAASASASWRMVDVGTTLALSSSFTASKALPTRHLTIRATRRQQKCCLLFKSIQSSRSALCIRNRERIPKISSASFASKISSPSITFSAKYSRLRRGLIQPVRGVSDSGRSESSSESSGRAEVDLLGNEKGSWESDEDGMSRLAADIAAMKEEERTNRRSTSYTDIANEGFDSRDGSMGVGNAGGGGIFWKELLDKFLVADFFFICVALFWLIGGVAQRAFLHDTSLMESWYNLWTPVFQPALGILMAGALVSGATAYFQSK